MTSQETKEFMCSSLVTWFASCLEDPSALSTFEDLVDGGLLHAVYLQIDSEPTFDGIEPSDGDSRTRIKNLEIVLGNIQLFYEKELNYLVIKIPDVYSLGKDPDKHVNEVSLILLLLLGCAVQCSNKERFITRIKTLEIDVQLAIVDCIKQVTDYQDVVVSQEVLENLNLGGTYAEIKKLIHEKGLYWKKWKNLESIVSTSFEAILPPTASCSDNTFDESVMLDLLLSTAAGEKPDSKSNLKGKTVMNSTLALKFDRLLQYYIRNYKFNVTDSTNITNKEEFHRHIVELADWKSKVRKQRQELEEKTEGLIECKEELKYCKELMAKLKEENQDLIIKARAAESLRDELDAAVERAEKADRLESEVARYREKLTDIGYYKSRIDELMENNRVLLETTEMLEGQLSVSSERAEKVLELESEIMKYKKLFNDITLERTSEETKYLKIREENTQLQSLIKTMAGELAGNNSISHELEDESIGSGDNRLSEQLSHNAQTRALKLELENRRLSTLIDSLKEKSSHEYAFQVVELEKDKKQLSLEVESLNELVDKLNSQSKDLENLYRKSIEDSEELQSRLSSRQLQFDKVQQDLLVRNEKFGELEKKYESSLKDRQHLQSLLENAERRIEETERNVNNRERQFNELKQQLDRVNNEFNAKISELETAMRCVEREKDIAQKEVQKLRKKMDEKDFTIDKITNTDEVLEKKLIKLTQENNNLASQISRLRDFERSSRELSSLVAIDQEALENLQSSLMTEKTNLQYFSTFLSRFGLDHEGLTNLSVDEIIDKMAEIPEIISKVFKKNKDKDMKVSKNKLDSESLFEKNKLQALISRVESEKTALTSQLASVRLAYSRLEVNMKEILNKYTDLQINYQELAKDQSKMQFLHDQLSVEYEKLSSEKDALRIQLRDSKNEARSMQSEREDLLAQANTLTSLRGEHSKLKEDFRNLFSNAEMLKAEYRNLQEEYRQNRIDSSTRDDRCENLELQVNNLTERCEMLIQMNTSLDHDRRTLMDHVSLLLKQYHELLTHSLEDKEHHHMEEKTYSEKMNNLCRQKEKLEEKIMEHYRKLDSCSNNKAKRSLGANFVHKVRKASSGLLKKNRRSLLMTEDDLKSSMEKNDDNEGDDDMDNDPEDPKIRSFISETVSTETEFSDMVMSVKPAPEDDLMAPLYAHAGTRRTVYYMDNTRLPTLSTKTKTYSSTSCMETLDQEEVLKINIEDQVATNKHQGEGLAECSTPTNDQHQRPFMLYNKISAVLNEDAVSAVPNNNDSQKDLDSFLNEESEQKICKPKNSIWYEYGCV